MKLKDFFQVEYIKHLSEKVVPNLKHGNDGMIFTRNQAEYVIGRSNYILKWKPPHLNTIDFLLVPNPKLNQVFQT
jgi:mRNA guanylyltransferase